jgi:glutaredoxin
VTVADVVLYSRPGCMFCAQVGTMLRDAEVTFRVVDVPDRAAQNELIVQWNARAFPLVLVDGSYIGGFTHVVRLHAQGRLRHIASGDNMVVLPNDAPKPEEGPPTRPRMASSTDLASKVPSSGTIAVAQAAGSLADYAKLGEYLQRTKKA